MLIQRNLRRMRLTHGWSCQLTQPSRTFTTSNPETQDREPIKKSQDHTKYQDENLSSKRINDRMEASPAFRLNTLLRDIAPTTIGRNDRTGGQTSLQVHKKHFALYDHLAYWQLRTPPSKLAPDGADAGHVPRGQALAGPREDPSLGLRLWESGFIQYKRDWRLDFVFDGRSRTCLEKARHVARSNSPRTHVVRTYHPYGTGPQNPQISVRENRRLLFVQGPLAKRIMTERVGDEGLGYDPTDVDYVHEFTTTPAQLFQFSALTFNSHYIHLDSQNGIVHGPLSYALMLRVAEQHLEIERGQRVRDFWYNLRKPLRVGQRAFICLKKHSLPEGVAFEDVRRKMHDDEEVRPQDRWGVFITREDGVVIAEGSLTTEEGV